jgi:hypothetical protein
MNAIKLAYSISDFCKLSSIGRTAVYQEIRDNNLRAVKRGGRTLVLHDDAQNYLRGLPAIDAKRKAA